MSKLLPNALRGILVDLSGTLHVEHEPTRNAVSALKKLRGSSLKIRFVTNTTKESVSALLERLQGIGFDITRKEIFTSMIAARAIVEKRALRPLLLLADAAMPEFDGIDTDDPNCVVVGLAPSLFEYESLTNAMRVLLKDGGSELIAIHKARYFQRRDGLALGPGPFVTALEYATDKKATIVGKPAADFFQLALDDMGIAPEAAIMIGDDVRDDVGAAISHGMRGVLVKTGKYRAGDESSKGCTPTYVADSFADAVEIILGELREQSRG
ncbi:Haloacid dehalogenase-like hydrolase domain-containing protein 2 [Irineochytrium annulatum]|nr:Haloacid dehalogenase-like hydrolase domain-containing protein 2 [Irineochytrium annulatum]